MKRALLALPLLVWGLALPGRAAAEDVVRRAVIVGVNDGGTLLEKLRYAEDDARRFSGVLRDLGGFDAEHTQLLVSPTADELLAVIAEEAKQVEADDGKSLFLFYYSGHADEIGLQLSGQHLPYEDLKAAIRQVPADVHLGVLDACRSGAITKVKGASIAEPFLQPDLAAEGEAWIAASAATEDAQESELLRGSFFTYYLTSGLRGAADTGDGWVSLNEAYQYAYDRTVARTAGTQGGTQHPSYDFQIQGNGDLKLTEVRRASARLRLPTELAGEVAVLRLPENTPIAEVAKVEGQVVTLAIEPGTYLLRRRVDGGVQEVTLSVSEGSDLEVDRWSDTQVEVASRKGAGTDDDEPSPTVFSLPVRTDGDQIEIRMRDEWRHVSFEGLQESPAVAGGLSIVPGLGQAYNRRWGAGALFLSSTIALHSVGWSRSHEQRGSLTGPNALTFLAFAVHGWAISDAIWRVRQQEEFEPKAGVTLSAETVWSGDVVYPWASGIAADWYANPYLSIGLDRTGFVVGPDENRYFLGTRVTVGPTWDKWRLAAIGAVGMVVVHDKTGDAGPGAEQEAFYPTDSVLSLSAGAQLRRYLTPRYFVQIEGRSEWLDGAPHGTVGLGLGFHIGR